jgi:hypothetical protein
MVLKALSDVTEYFGNVLQDIHYIRIKMPASFGKNHLDSLLMRIGGFIHTLGNEGVIDIRHCH